ncbi:S1 RNA-binding domain-containing protein [Streptomyces brasiliscabiei]|uniref:S1 RNA-binding domain-containing protein n=1 Tax=Streptomyces brasiliscabiei TaxID=2736302 RepID=A0ABU8GST5_9ACTN
MRLGAEETPELWAFLGGLRMGEVLGGTVAAVERFGVFVALDDGPEHPVFPGVGFITVPELTWRRIGDASEVVRVGQRVACEFLQFDTWNGEARLSLRAMEPDPLQEFADRALEGRRLRGTVTKVVPFGVFVEVAEGIEGLVHLSELTLEPLESPEGVVRVGEEVMVVVTEVDRVRRRVVLSRVGAALPSEDDTDDDIDDDIDDGDDDTGGDDAGGHKRQRRA